jgi:hypothetical protein
MNPEIVQIPVAKRTLPTGHVDIDPIEYTTSKLGK